MKKILVIAPHADDEVLGCGATIAKLASLGNEIHILVATNAHIGAPEIASAKGIERVRNEALEAHKILGVKETHFEDFPAPALNAYPEFKISVAIAKLLEKIKPDILFLPHPGDLHQDHKAIYRAALVAARPQGNYSIKEIYCYETLSETEWAPYQGDNFFKPNYFIDVTNFIEKKLEAMKCFNSQLKVFPHSRSIETIMALSTLRGNTVGVKNAESFEVERIILV
jgi:LmbE family N-acetylglucosaminyl deacetylase